MNGNNAETKRNKSYEVEVLTFTCPHCGEHRIEEDAMMWRNIEWIAVPSDPHYDWADDPDHNVNTAGAFYSAESDNNCYRCRGCGAPLLDKDGNIFWGSKLLYEWLRQRRDQESMEQTRRKMLKFRCPDCGGNRLEEVVADQTSACEVKGVFEDGEIVTVGLPDVYDDKDRFFRCRDCEFELMNEDGLVTGEEELVDWLFGHCREEEDAGTDNHEKEQ